MKMRETRQIKAGKLLIGGGAPVSVQSMTKTDTSDIQSTVAQIKTLEAAGCELVRCAVPDEKAAKAIKEIKKRVRIPVAADIHFNYKLALLAIDNGADKIRINPGNIGDDWKVKEIIAAAKAACIPVRIGVNAGSLEKYALKKRGENSLVVARKMVKKAASFVRFFEKNRFYDIVLSLKASDTLTSIQAYTLMAKECTYSFHIGITEAGTAAGGTIKSAVGLGILLNSGIGDTLRVSLASDPVDEIRVGYEILKTLKLRKKGVDLVVCPTCGRCGVKLFPVAEEIERRVADIKKPLKLAVMGCVVNGPGEAAEADLGLACGQGSGIIFKDGKVLRKVSEKMMVDEFMKEVKKL
ncbi:MAG: flavodoxin-dependent (E)-4-hydroxy-3-methylbut-2-enyl-diphosphate synthase [Candidatus Firestonebacteria bacterium]